MDNLVELFNDSRRLIMRTHNAENRIITRDCAENLAVLHIIQRVTKAIS